LPFHCTLLTQQVTTSQGLLASGTPDEFTVHCIENQDAAENIAVAFNNKLAARNGNTLTEYPSLKEYKANNGTSFKFNDDIQQIVANTATFTALTSTGTVYTWGDPRFEACLARTPSKDQ